MSRDLYQEVTDRVIAALEAGTAPWVKPWATMGEVPHNAITGKPYRGINTLLLGMSPYAGQSWMTYKQATDIGANVRKGEHGTMIVFFKPWKVTDKNTAPDDNAPERTIPVLRNFTVFNVAQIDNLPAKYLPKAPEPRPEHERHAQADAMLSIATIRHGGNRACYAPSADLIMLPEMAQFHSAPDYYATALHELTHWTGHESRCARQYGKRFGDTAYAREELVAEMGAAFLCASAGIDGQLQHPAYIANWLQVLKNDKRAVLVAAGAAQKAADYVLGKAGFSGIAAGEPETAEAA